MGAYSPMQADLDRASLAQLVADVSAWSRSLDEINRKERDDPDGIDGARLESLIERAQPLIAERATRLLGVPVPVFDRVRGK